MGDPERAKYSANKGGKNLFPNFLQELAAVRKAAHRRGGRTKPRPEMEVEAKEGAFLLGSPTFVDLGGGRFRCSETGHELPDRELDSYGKSKRCRLALIDASISQKKAPLNFFKQDPCSKSKLICELTGDSINKSEEHIWKHISGRKFLRKLELREAEMNTTGGEAAKHEEPLHEPLSIKSSKKDVENGVPEGQSKDEDEEADFWVPPVGDRWDMDNGNDRWESIENSDHASDKCIHTVEAEEDDQDTVDLMDLPKRTKRMAIGPSNDASRKKKTKTDRAVGLPSSR